MKTACACRFTGTTGTEITEEPMKVDALTDGALHEDWFDNGTPEEYGKSLKCRETLTRLFALQRSELFFRHCLCAAGAL